MMRKLKAFTLIELLVGLLISCIVIAISYVCYEIIYKQSNIYRHTNEKISQTLLLNTLLKRDFFISQLIIKKNESEILFTNESKKIIYRFESGYITRVEREVNDTFYLQPLGIQFKFMGQPLKNQNDLMDELLFVLLKDEDTFFHFKKQYSATIFMNTKNH